MPAIFVTATGTDVGKTFVTAGLIRQLRRRGHPVEALKPIVTGFDPAAPENSDPAVLLAALGRSATPEEIRCISPLRYRAPLSPDMAARAEGRPVDVDALIGFCREAIAAARGTLLIEGVGGLMVPLDGRRLVLDWMVELALPLVVVAGSYLGTISHTLSALDVLARRNLTVRALVVSETAGATVPLDETLTTLANFAGDVPLLAVPRLPDPTSHHSTFERLAEMVSAA
jgi:dethiobiotin synthetase